MCETITRTNKILVHQVVVLTQSSEASLEKLPPNIKVVVLDKKEGNDFSVWGKLYKLIKKNKPDILHTYNLPTLEYNILGFLLRVPKRIHAEHGSCLLYTSPSPRDATLSRMPSSA